MALPERQLIERIRRRAAVLPANAPGAVSRAVTLGIGDDCAILQIPAGWQLLATTDLCVEDVHFRRDWHPAPSVGHRCLARGLSDIAAMGGEPVACFLSLALPATLSQRWVDGFMTGLLRLAQQFKISLAGGDIASSQKITAHITVLGKTPSGRAVLRSAARPGDRIYVTGELGGPAAILQRLYAGEKISARVSNHASNRHFYPTPRVEVGGWLRQKKLVHAMIDLSDGLSVDLAHLCRESNLSGVVEAGALPLARGANLDLALHGGEDYELLFTAPEGVKIPPCVAGVPITQIGEMTGEPRRSGGSNRVRVRDQAGRLTALRPRGWEHFRRHDKS